MSGSGSSLLEGSMPDYDTRRPYIGPGIIGQNNFHHEPFRGHARPPHVNFAAQRDFTRFNDHNPYGYGQALTRYGQEQLRRGTFDESWSTNPLENAGLPTRAVTPFGIPNLAGPLPGSAVSLPARRLGGPPPDVELSDDEEDAPAPADAVRVPRAYNISNAAARAVVAPPLQLSASQTRRNMLTTELKRGSPFAVHIGVLR